MRLSTVVVAWVLAMTVVVACGGATGSDIATPVSADASSPTDGGAASDAASTTTGGGADGGVNPPNAGPGGSTSTLNCGSTTCAIPATACCISEVQGGGVAYACATACGDGNVGNGGGNDHEGGDTTTLKCTGASNCAAGTVCCIRQVDNGASSECKASCTRDDAQLCDPAAATTGCAATSPCSNSQIRDFGLPKTFGTCGGKGG